jgi:predicted transglutaminase-like cysteine proteinase
MFGGVLRSVTAALLLLSVCTGAGAQTAGTEPAFAMQVSGGANAPVGYVAFCRGFPRECLRRGTAHVVRLGSRRWEQLVRVNAHVNRAVAPMMDSDLYGTEEVWTLPTAQGDCEDYVLLKRRLLIERGWPSGALLVAVVFDEIGDGHAVLIARTDRGELVLDNKADNIRPWHQTAYRYVKRQSVADPNRWVAVADRRGQSTTASLR